MHSNRLAQSLNVLSCKPVTNQPIIRQTKAQKYFQQTAVLPKSLKDDMMLSMNNPEIDGRPSKPVSVEVETLDENDPFYQIERVTNKIGNLVTNYEEQAEQEHYAMLQELDSNFQINNYDPKEILDESRKAVDDLMNKAKVLKETQAGMLDDLSDWFSREEKSLKDADLTSNVSLDTSVPVTTDDLLQVLQSSAGTSQERITRAIALHGDIVSHAFFAIHELKRKNHDQEVLISDLQHQLSETSSRKIQRQQSSLRPGSSESQKRLQEALMRISSQDETIKRLNERIEQLVGESVLKSRLDDNSEKDETSALLKAHDVLSMEMKISKQTTEIATLTDQLFSLKHELHSVEAEKSFLESEISSYKEKIDLEKTRYESLQKQMLELVNEQEDNKNGNNEEKKKIKKLTEKVVELQNDIQKLNDKILNDKKLAFQEAEIRVKELRKEFEAREIELKKRQLNEAIDSSQQTKYYEALQLQHSNEMSLMKRNCDDTIESLKKKFENDKDLLEKEFTEKIKSFQKQLKDVSNIDITKLIDSMERSNEAKIIEIKKSYADKLDDQRNEFQKHLDSLNEELKKKEIEIINLNAEIDEYKANNKLFELPNDELQNLIKQLKGKIADYEEKMKAMSEEFQKEKDAEIEAVRGEFIDQYAKCKEFEEMNKKLKIQIGLLKEQILKGTNDDSIIELTNNLAHQSYELNEAKEKLEEFNKKLNDSQNKIIELTKENNELKSELEEPKKVKLLDFIYCEQFALSRPIEAKSPAVIYQPEPHQRFLMKYEIAASVEPRLQEHVNKLKAKPVIDNNSLFINEIKEQEVIEKVQDDTEKVQNVIEKNCDDTEKVQNVIEKNCDDTEKVQNVSEKVQVTDIKSENLKIQSKLFLKLDFSPVVFSEEKEIDEKRSNLLCLSSFEIVDVHEKAAKVLSFAYPMKFFIEPFNDKEMVIFKEKQSSRKADEPTTSTFVHVAQLGFHMNESLFVDSSNNDRKECLNVAVQVDIQKKPENPQKPFLSHQPALEIFAVTASTVEPEEPIVLEPSNVVSSNVDSIKDKEEKEEMVLVTKSGDLIDIPKIEEVNSSTQIEAANAVSKMVIQETAVLSKKLQLVVSEIQSIDQEPDPMKRLQMQETLGIQLDVEKDSLISQMRERITELEQMMNKVVENKTETENVKVKDSETNVNEITETENDVIENEALIESSVLMSSSYTQTDLVELENVGTTSTDFSSPEDLEVKESTKKMQMSSTLTLINEQMNDHELGISSPSQILDVDLPKTVDLSTEFGVQYVQITPYSQRSQVEDGSEKSSIVLQITGKIECDYGYNQSFTQTSTNEQFSVIPQNRPSLSVVEQDMIEVSTEKTYASIGVSNSSEPLQEGRQIIIEEDEKGVKRGRVNLNNVKTATLSTFSKQNFFNIITKNVLDIKPISLKGDVRVAQIQSQAEQISELKKHILRLQFSSPENIPHLISTVESDISHINENINAIQSSSTGVLMKRKEIEADKKSVSKNSNNLSSTAMLREAIETSFEMSTVLLKNDSNLISSQNSIFTKLNEATNNFLNEMSKPAGATTECQSKFLRQINDISNEFSTSLTAIQATIRNDENMKESLENCKEQLHLHEKFIESLQKENLDLKLGTGKSHIVQQLADIKDELDNLIHQGGSQNHLIKSFKEAQKIIPKVANRGRNDNIARQAGVSLILDRIIHLSRPKQTQTNNNNENEDDCCDCDWEAILSLLGEAVVMLDEHDAKMRARKIIDELNLQIKMLQSDVTKLQTDLIIAGRDLQVADDKYVAHVRSLQRSLEASQEQARMLERELETAKAIQSNKDKETRYRTLENELEVMRHADRKRLEELSEMAKKNSELTHENKRLEEELTKIREMYSALFNQCTDTQTANDSLKSKTEEIFQEAEIAKQKAQALDKIRQSASLQANDLAKQLSLLVGENAQLQNMLIKSQQKERELENSLFQLKNLGPSKFEENFESEVPPVENFAINSNAKVIKIYQQKIDDYMNLLAKNGNDLVDLRARHATDQKSIIMIQNEMRRNQNEFKINQLRYDCAKKENSLLAKTIANRDETIRMLKREIERLRSLLKVQGPLKQKIQLFEKEKNTTEIDYINTQNELQKTKLQRDKYAPKNPKVSSYFDGILQRQQETLARLDKRRKELREIEEKNKIETLRAVSQVVNLAELQIPEEVILNLMPKPKPARHLQQQSKLIEMQREKNLIEEANLRKDVNFKDVNEPTKFDTLNAYSSSFQNQQSTLLNSSSYASHLSKSAQPHYMKQPSYADTLQMIGNLAGQKSPRTLQEMLRNSRHNKIMLPVQQIPPKKKNDTKSILSIKPLRK